MSWWKTLGKVGAVGAAPFTGGASLAAIPILDAIGGAASGAAAGSAQQRVQEQPGIIGTQNSNLMGQQFNANEQDRGVKRQMLSALLGGLQDASIGKPAGSTIPTFAISGGLRPSALAGGKEALMQALSQPTMSAPKPLDLPQAGLAEKILGGVGMGANVLSTIARIKGQQPNVGTSGINPNAPMPPGVSDPNIWNKVRF